MNKTAIQGIASVCLVLAVQAMAMSVETAAEKPVSGELLAPKAFRAAARKVSPSLVTIESFGGVSGAAGSPQAVTVGNGPTTGVIISSDGYVVTSTFNFITNPPVITVVLRDGRRHIAKLLGRDETRKICLLKIDGAADLPTPQIAPRADLKVGQWAIALGVGFGDTQPALSAGIISATSRISGRAVQTDANISPANYGGPLVDIDGRVIGICVPLHPESGDVASGADWYDSGIGFAVPLDGADSLLAALKAGKTILPARLGVQVKAADERGQGVVIVELVKDSPAGKAGLQADDVILAIDSQPILDVVDLRTMLGRYVAGDVVKIRIRRGSEEQEFGITLTAAP
jgi:serine protease Do